MQGGNDGDDYSTFSPYDAESCVDQIPGENDRLKQYRMSSTIQPRSIDKNRLTNMKASMLQTLGGHGYHRCYQVSGCAWRSPSEDAYGIGK